MGYSNSDKFDIYPILHSRESGWRGLWINHTETDREILEKVGLRNFKLEANTSKFTQYVIKCFNVSNVDINSANKSKSDTPEWSKAFTDWIDRLRLKEGDGLNWIGRLYIQRGKLREAKTCYEKAVDKYKGNKFIKKWLSTTINLAFVEAEYNPAQSLSLLFQIRSYIEEKNLQKQFNSIYARVLLNIAGSSLPVNLLASNDLKKLEEIRSLIYKGLRYAQEGKSYDAVAHAYELLGDVSFSEGNFQEALDNYTKAYHISSEITGDINAVISVLTAFAKCLSYLNQEDQAREKLDKALDLVQKSENESLIYPIVYSFLWFIKSNSLIRNL